MDLLTEDLKRRIKLMVNGPDFTGNSIDPDVEL
jgi:hypothetical protein